jgi:ribosome-associated toxin RatA of RatAB toxin-antitoxin module
VLEGSRATELPLPAAEAYAVVAAVEGYPAWQSLVDHVDVRERDAEGRPLVVATALDAGIRVLRLELRYAYDPPAAVRWELVRGDVKALRGSWEVEPLGGAASAVTYRLEVDPGRTLGLVLRGGVADRVRAKVIDGTLEDLRRHVEPG